jgi:hypothetical protein
MKNIHILPTDKPSANILLKKDDGTFQIFDTTFYNIWKAHQEFGDFSPSNATYQNIYITSDEEIKEGNWFIYEDELIHRDKGKIDSIWVNAVKNGKKIILTTDQDLIKDGVQAIDDEFLEWFVNNPSCEFVQVIDDENITDDGMNIYSIYKIIIPKEKPKQETLEEAGKDFIENIMKYSFNSDETKTFANRLLKCIEFGANWQAEQDKNKYSEQEVYSLLYKLLPDKEELDMWFEQFKKK